MRNIRNLRKLVLPIAFSATLVLPTAVFAQEEMPTDRMPAGEVQPDTGAAPGERTQPGAVGTPSQMQEDRGATGMCGSPALPMATGDQLAVSPLQMQGRPDEGVNHYSAVRGSIVHAEGNLMLLRLDGAGAGNAAPNQSLAGDTWAVVQLPNECSPSTFDMGQPVIAVGTPNGQGILQALQVTPAG